MTPLSKTMQPGKVYLIMDGVHSFAQTMYFTFFMLMMIQVIKMNPFELVLTGTVLELTVFLFEVPTGIVADVHSRRLSVFIGYVILGIAFAMTGLLPSFWPVMISQALFGLGWTFISGAGSAWLVDEVGEDSAGEVFLRASQIGQVASLTAIPTALVIAMIFEMQTAMIVAGGLCLGIAVFILMKMGEEGFTPVPVEERETWGSMRKTFTEGFSLIRGSQILIGLALLELVFGIYSEGYDRLWSAHLLENFVLPSFGMYTEIIWFAILGGASGLLSIAGTEIIRRRADIQNQTTLAWIMTGLVTVRIAVLFVFVLTGNFVIMLVMNLSFDVFRSMGFPVFETWINKNIKSEVRATVLSMTNQMNAIGQVIGGPPVGWIGTAISVRAGLLASAILLAPAGAITGSLALIQGKQAGERAVSAQPVSGQD